MGVGNEQWGQPYIDRYAPFAKALKARYPEVKLVAAAGPDPGDERFKFAWAKLRGLNADIIDEHCYANPSWFFNKSHRYDQYDPSGPKVFMGEYAAQSVATVSTKNQNNLECALAEAAYLTGLERNAAVVRMASYAPLFGNVDAWQWKPNLIWVDSLRIYATPNYYVQQLFSCNRGDAVLPVTLDGLETSPEGRQNIYASATHDDQTGELILKVVNPGAQAQTADLKLNGWTQVQAEGRSIVLAGDRLDAVNSLDQPTAVAPVETKLADAAASFAHTFPGYSVTVLRIKGQ